MTQHPNVPLTPTQIAYRLCLKSCVHAVSPPIFKSELYFFKYDLNLRAAPSTFPSICEANNATILVILISSCGGNRDWAVFLFASTCAVLGFWICPKAGRVAALFCTFPGCVGSNHMDWILMLQELQAEARQTQQSEIEYRHRCWWISSGSFQKQAFLFVSFFLSFFVLPSVIHGQPIMCP